MQAKPRIRVKAVTAPALPRPHLSVVPFGQPEPCPYIDRCLGQFVEANRDGEVLSVAIAVVLRDRSVSTAYVTPSASLIGALAHVTQRVHRDFEKNFEP